MSDFLTAKQVIEIVKIDRTTLYRMLKDGRLKGVKIGSQWRFDKDEVNRLISGIPIPEDDLAKDFENVIPINCVLPIQDVIAEIADIGVVVADKNGEQLTEISNSCKFCELIRSSEKGLEACNSSWKKLTEIEGNQPKFTACHAGLQYARTMIHNDGDEYAMLIAGQFTIPGADNELQFDQIKKLAGDYDLDENDLIDASKEIKVLDERWENKISYWLTKIAGTFEYVIKERKGFLKRFQKIVDISKQNGAIL